MTLRCVPAHQAPWEELEALFGARGACGGCWCMLWRRARMDFEAGKGAGNRAALRALWAAGEPIGLLGYQGEQAVGWVSVAPRPQFVYFKTSRVLKPEPGEQGVWCVSCLFVAPALRRQGLAAQLLRAAADWARSQGAQRVEGYPTEPRKAQAAPVFLWTGTPGAFEQAGYQRCPNPHGQRPIYRLD